jgi:hypothetical protein
MKLFRRYVPESLKRIIVNVTATHQGNYQWIETGIFFFSAHGLSIKLSVNLLTTDLPTDQKLHTEC